MEKSQQKEMREGVVKWEMKSTIWIRSVQMGQWSTPACSSWSSTRALQFPEEWPVPKGLLGLCRKPEISSPMVHGQLHLSLAEEQGYHKGCWITWTHSNADKARHPQVISLHLQALLATRHLLIPVLCQNGIQNLQGASGISWCQLLCSLPCGTWLTPPDQSHSLVCGSQGFTGPWCSEQTP